MNVSPRALAEDASFNAFMNCYLREVDAGTWHASEAWCEKNRTAFALEGKELIELHLPFSCARVVMDVVYRSYVGRHHFGCIYLHKAHAESDLQAAECWEKADLMFVLFLVVREIYQRQARRAQHDAYASSCYFEKIKKNEMQLLARLIDSYQLMTHCLEARCVQSHSQKDKINFIGTEQQALYGHWLHPTPKSRQGMSWWQQDHYNPELRGSFQLHYFAVDKSLVSQGSSLSQSAAEIIYSELTKMTAVPLSNNEVLIPTHPLQAQYLLLQKPVKKLIAAGTIKDLGPLGTEYTPTSSVRTAFNADSDWMYKFSIPVRITNSLRNNRKQELKVGAVIDKFMRKSGFLQERTNFRIIDDPAYITVAIPGGDESGFELILRRNVFRQSSGVGICSVLTLVQAPLSMNDQGLQDSLLKKIIIKLAVKEGRSTAEVAIDWFSRYWDCAIASLILLYDKHGIALEAHQQNSLLDVSQGYPTCFYYRDNQGFYLSNAYREAMGKIEPEMLTITEMFYDDRITFEGISYYMFINQLFSVIYRLGADELVDEALLVECVRDSLTALREQLNGVGKRFVEHLLQAPHLSYKKNLMARVHDIDELHEGMERAVYGTIPNPLSVRSVAKHESGKMTSVNAYVV